jgi:SagB-type dehydrogenase family enzyme
MARGAASRFRRSRHLVGFWRGRWFFIHNYATGREAVVSSAIPSMLDFFADWCTIRSFARKAQLSTREAGRRVAAMVVDGVLEASTDRARRLKESAMARWEFWNPGAGYFHSATRDARYVDPTEGEHTLAEKARTVRVPPQVKRYPGAPSHSLPRVDGSGAFASVLLDRRTWRQFSKRPLPLESLSTLLGLSGGIHHWATVHGQPDLPLKTSPSGGSRHPIEIYVWARRVAGLSAGFYHYACDRHRLEFVKSQPRRVSVERYLPTQFWYEEAPLLVFFSAVYARYQWKYSHPRAYRATLIEAGHQCQTFCLTATSLGLAPFCAMALADSEIESVLGLDGISESVLYAAGAGIRTTDRDAGAMPEGFPPAGVRSNNRILKGRR